MKVLQNDTKGDIGQRHKVEREASFLEGTEETGSHLQAYGCNKEYQAELLDDVEHVVVAGDTEGTQKDSHEEHPCDTEGDAFEFKSAE